MNKEDQTRQNINDQDVDFEPLINWFLSITGRIANFFSFLISSLKNNLKLVFSFVAIGVFVGLGVYFFAQKKYSASFQLATNHTTNLISNNMLKSLTRLANDKSYQNLSSTLEIPIEDAKQISALLYLDHNYLPVADEDTVAESRPFFIYIESYSSEILVDLQKSLIDYLEQQPLTTEYREREKFEISSKIEKHRLELKRLDSLKAIVAESIEPRAEGKGFIYGEPINSVEIYRESERIHDDYLSLISRLNALKSVKVISKFVPSEKPIFPRFRHILFVVLGFFLLGLIFAFRTEIRKKYSTPS